MSNTKIASVRQNLAGGKSHALKLSLLACAATLALNSAPARADGGHAGSVGSGGVTYPGGAGGVDGPLGSATGSDAPSTGSYGGGGGVDLTTGNGAPGGAGKGTNNQSAPRGTTGLVGTTGQFVTAPAQISTTVSGGTGSAGQTEVIGVNTSGGNGGGGVGVSATSAVTVNATGRVTGGAGFSFATPAFKGGAGGGGVGIFSSTNVTVDSGGQVTGGAGGSNTSGPNEAGGGGGAAAILLTGSGTVQNSGLLTGGAGGRSTQASGGDGGASIQMLAGGTVINMAGATIAGGTGGNGRFVAVNSTSPGDGGAGIKGMGISVINAGTISGGAGGTPTGGTVWAPVDGQAIQFTGGVNALEIWSGSNIAGNVQAFSTADTFKLGGSTDAAFDLSQLGAAGKYQGFGQFVKTGASTWTLTGATTDVTPWTLTQGALQIASDAQLGDASGGLTFNGGTLRVTGTGMTGTPRAITWGTNGGGFDIDDPANTFTLTPSLSGGGPLTKLGAGTLQLADNNTYTGGTTVSGGTLIGSASSFGSGVISDNAALIINQPTDANLGNALNGTGSFTKQGVGRLNYTGTGTLSGGTIVAAGLLSVNGSLASSAVTVQSGASLGGNGTVGATTVQSGGTIAPGNSIGTLHVNGAYAQAAGSVYQVEVDPASNASDQIAVNGAATLASGAGLNVTKTGSGDYKLGTIYTVLTTTNGLTGNYALSGQTAALSPYIGLKDSYDARNAYLTVVQTADPASAAQTPNQAAVGGAMDSLPPTNPVDTGVLNSPDPASARSAFDRLSGEALASAKGVLISSSFLVRDTTLDRLRDVFCAAGDDKTAHDRSAGCVASRDRPTVWVQGFGDWGQVNGNGNASGVSQSTGGFLIGANVPVQDWRIGVFGGYSRSDFNVDARASTGVSDNYHLGAYGGTQWGDLGLRLGASYSWSGIDTDRLVAFSSFSNDLKASYNAGTTQVFGELGQQFMVDQFGLEPFANLAYVNLRTGGFSEVGGEAALTSKADTTEDTFSTLGVRPSTTISLGSVSATLRGMLGWRHTFGEVTPSSVVSFAGSSAFTVDGAPIARDAGLVEAGVSVNVSGNAAVGLTYGGQFSSRQTDNGIRGTLAITF